MLVYRVVSSAAVAALALAFLPGVAVAADGSRVDDAAEQYRILAQAIAHAGGVGDGVVTANVDGSLSVEHPDATTGDSVNGFSRAPMVARITTPSVTDGWAEFAYADGRVVRVRLIGRGAASDQEQAGRALSFAGGLSGGREHLMVLGETWFEDFVRVPGSEVAAHGVELRYEFVLPDGAELVEDGGEAFVIDANGIMLLRVSQPIFEDQMSQQYDAVLRVEQGELIAGLQPWDSPVGEVLADPNFSAGSASYWYAEWCTAAKTAATGIPCEQDDEVVPDAWSGVGVTAEFNVNDSSGSTDYGLYVGNKPTSFDSASQTMLVYTSPTGTNVDIMNLHANVLSNNSKFKCRAELGSSTSSMDQLGSWVVGTQAGAPLNESFNGSGPKRRAGFRLKLNVASFTATGTDTHRCDFAATNDWVVMTMRDTKTPPAADASHESSSAAEDEIKYVDNDPNAKWYKADDEVLVPYNVEEGDGFNAANNLYTSEAGFTPDGIIDGSGIYRVDLRTQSAGGGATFDDLGVHPSPVCIPGAVGSDGRPCELQKAGTMSLILNDSTVPAQGLNKIYVGAWDFSTRGGYSTAGSTFRYDSIAPTNPSSVSDGAGTDQQWLASSTQMQANWSAGADSSPGLIGGYDWCIVETAPSTTCASAVASDSTVGAGTSTIASGSFTDGLEYFFCVRTRDLAGNTPADYVCSNGVTVDTSLPVVPAPVPTDAATTSADVDAFAVATLDAAWTQPTDTASSGIAGVSICLVSTSGGVPLDCVGALATVPDAMAITTYQWTIGSPVENAWYFTCVQATDVAGNVGVLCTDGAQYDTTAPSIPAPGPVDGTDLGADIDQVSGGTLAATWSTASDGDGSGVVSVTACLQVSASAPVDCTGAVQSEVLGAGTVTHSWTYTAPASGEKLFTCVFATDAADLDSSTGCTDGVVVHVLVSYAYDGDGQRLVEVTDADTVKYTWDRTLPYGQVALERDGSGAVLNAYVFGLERVMAVNNSSTRYFHSDYLGSTVNLSNASGVAVWEYSYGPFGEIRSEVTLP